MSKRLIQVLMSRGLGSMQRGILSSLEAQGGRATTEAIMKAISPACDWNDAFRISFYRALRGLQKRGRIWWDKEHGGPKSAYGLVSSRKRRVLLIDVDSIIPNLAIMKLSAYHKAKGDTVLLQRGLTVASRLDKWDVVHISCVYTKHEPETRSLAKQFPDSEVHLGGSGVDLKSALPNEIEHIMPDYSIYHEIFPETKFTSYGFTQRGCPRSCPWCIVHEKGRACPRNQ